MLVVVTLVVRAPFSTNLLVIIIFFSVLLFVVFNNRETSTLYLIISRDFAEKFALGISNVNDREDIRDLDKFSGESMQKKLMMQQAWKLNFK